MRAGLPFLLTLGCAEEKPDPAPLDTGSCASCGEDTAPPDTAAPDSGGAHTGDSAPADTGDTDGDTADTGEDTAEPEPCASATFTAADGTVTDLTAVFTKGDYHIVIEPGTLSFCPGEWFVRLIVRADLTVVGLGETRGDTVLSGGEQGTVISVDGPAALTLSHVTIERGSALGSGNDAMGGGVRCKELGTLTIDDVYFHANEAYDGGALHARGCSTAVTDSDFVGNVGQDDGGAASFYEGDARFERALFQDNSGRDGAGILHYFSVIEVVDSVFQENAAIDYGGAIGNFYGTLSVHGSTFLANSSRYGGALAGYGESYVEDSRFEGNYAAPGDGGAILYGAFGTVEGSNCDFLGNTPDDISLYMQPPLILGKGSSFRCDGSTCEEL